MPLRVLFLLCSLGLLSACASGFETHYKPASPLDTPMASYETCYDTKVERISPYDRADKVIEDMKSKGYVLIGQAKWESIGEESNQTALDQGRKVGACIVLWSRLEAGVEHSTRTVSNYTPARKEKVVIDGKEHTIEIPAKTTYHQEPYDYKRYEFRGYFFAKMKKHQ